MGILPTEDVVFAFLEIFFILFWNQFTPLGIHIWIILLWSNKNVLFFFFFFEWCSVLFPRFSVKGNMKRDHVVHLFVLFFRLLFVLFHSVHQRKSHFFELLVCLFIYMGSVDFVLSCVLSFFRAQKIRAKLMVHILYWTKFSMHVFGLTLTLASFSFSILTGKNMDLESDQLGSSPNPHCS